MNTKIFVMLVWSKRVGLRKRQELDVVCIEKDTKSY